MKKKFDCVEMKHRIQEKFWIEAGCTIDGLIMLHNERIKDNQLLKEFYDWKEKEKQTTTTKNFEKQIISALIFILWNGLQLVVLSSYIYGEMLLPL